MKFDYVPAADSLAALRRRNREIGILASIMFDAIRYNNVCAKSTTSNALLGLLWDWCGNAPGAADYVVKKLFELERCGALSYGEADFLISQVFSWKVQGG